MSIVNKEQLDAIARQVVLEMTKEMLPLPPRSTYATIEDVRNPGFGLAFRHDREAEPRFLATVTLKDSLTGEVRVTTTEVNSLDPRDEFIWSEGNCSCDCTRAVYFAKAAGNADPDLPCSNGRYLVRIEAEGSVLHDEIEEPEP